MARAISESKCEADEDVEGADLGEAGALRDRKRWRHRSDESGDAIVEADEPGLRLRQVGADGIVQLEVPCPFDRQLLPVGEALGEEPLEGYAAALVVGLDELVADDGHDLAVLDVIEQVFPREAVVHRTLHARLADRGKLHADVSNNDAGPQTGTVAGVRPAARADGHRK